MWDKSCAHSLSLFLRVENFYHRLSLYIYWAIVIIACIGSSIYVCTCTQNTSKIFNTRGSDSLQTEGRRLLFQQFLAYYSFFAPLLISSSCSVVFAFMSNSKPFWSLHDFAILSLQIFSTLNQSSLFFINRNSEWKEKITEEIAIPFRGSSSSTHWMWHVWQLTLQMFL